MAQHRMYFAVVALAALVATAVLALKIEPETISGNASARPVAHPVVPDGMAPLTAALAERYAYYKLEFFPDGYPGRRTDDGLIPHPIYGPYVIADYLDQHTANPDPKLVRSARRVADAAIARMDRHGEGLVFWYPYGLSSMPGHFYSGLAQARYLDTFYRLSKVTGDVRYRDAAIGAFKSLMIPVAEGGVMKRTQYGAAIEEWPHEVATYTLNGWASALLVLHDYASETKVPGALEFLMENLDALEAMLPLFDAPELANSRYKLTGYAQVRADFNQPAKVLSGSIEIPGEGVFPFSASESQWHNHVKAQRPKQAEMNVVLGRISHPRPNILRLDIEAEAPGEATILIGTGSFDPMRTNLVPNVFEEIAKVPLAEGRNEITVQVPWDKADLIAYPTNFNKRLAGKRFNVYHFIHIDTLRDLHAKTGRTVFRYYADKWDRYVARWPSMPVYSDQGLEFDRYLDNPS